MRNRIDGDTGQGVWLDFIALTPWHSTRNLVVENDIEEGAVHVDPAVVLDKPQFAKLVQTRRRVIERVLSRQTKY